MSGKGAGQVQVSESAARARRYIDYDFVRLVAAVPSAPPKARTENVFYGTAYRFFVEAGMFCVECKATGIVLDFPPSQIHFCQRPRPAVEAELPA